MGLRGEGGQRWKQERKALLGLFSSFGSRQERVEPLGTPGPTVPALDGAPRTGIPPALTRSELSLGLSMGTAPQGPVRNNPLVLGF